MAKAKLQGSQLKNFRRKVSRLKALGLISKNIDTRKQKSTRYMRDVVEKKFKDVLDGKAVAVKVPSRKVAKTFQSGFRTRGKLVVIPLEKGATRPKWNKKRREIIGRVDLYGTDFERIYVGGDQTELAKYAKRKNVKFVIPLGHGFRTFDNYDDLETFMFPYEHPTKGTSHHAYSKWRDYVIVDESTDADDFDDNE